MDKKKLIGTIIGVVAFAALIAGATYAWLTYNATITNGNYLLGSMNFSVAYEKGTAVNAVPILTNPTATQVTSGGGHLAVTASKASGSAPGDLTILLNTNSATAALISSGALKYAACVGTCSEDNLTEEDTYGTVTSTSPIEIIESTPLTASPTTYNIYLWLDSALVTNQLIEANASYSGYISASALQTDKRTQ